MFSLCILTSTEREVEGTKQYGQWILPKLTKHIRHFKPMRRWKKDLWYWLMSLHMEESVRAGKNVFSFSLLTYNFNPLTLAAKSVFYQWFSCLPQGKRVVFQDSRAPAFLRLTFLYQLLTSSFDTSLGPQLVSTDFAFRKFWNKSEATPKCVPYSISQLKLCPVTMFNIPSKSFCSKNKEHH